MTLRGVRVVAAVLIAGGLTSAAAGLAPIVLPLIAPPTSQQEAVQDLARTWPSASSPTTAGDPPQTPRASDGVAFAVLRIPRFGTDWSRVVAEGLSAQRVLDVGAIGHYPTSAMPGALGNFAIAGHREAGGGALLHLPELRAGDRVLVDTARARYVYRVTWSGTVAPTDVGVVAPVPGHPGRPPTRRLITLQTCTPPLIDTDRFIVRGELVSWSAR